ncbi:MAG: iron donor protein CyaY [Burkholderiaceae bacterium]
MSEQQFISECEQLLNAIEDALDGVGIDVDFNRTGHVLEIEFDNSSVIVVNGQVPMRQIWLAAPSGAHHFHKLDGRWVDTRSNEGFNAVLSRCASVQSGQEVIVAVG